MLGSFDRSNRLSELKVERVKEGKIVFIKANFISIMVEAFSVALMIMFSRHVLMRIVLAQDSVVV